MKGIAPENVRVAGFANLRLKRSEARRKRFVWTWTMVFIVVIVTQHLIASDLLGSSAAVGRPAPDVTLNTTNGGFRLSEQRGKVLVFYFSFPG